MKIPLTQGKFAIIDAEDYGLVSAFRWQAHYHKSLWYAVCRGRRKMHRLILGVTDSKIMVDHRDGDGLNNRRSNLRLCTNSQNQANRRYRVRGSSKYKGVHMQKSTGTWIAQARANGKRKYLGTFANERDAALAYDAAARSVYGEFARVNFPEERP